MKCILLAMLLCVYFIICLFFLVFDKPCREGCACHYFQTYHANVFTCTGPGHPKLPNQVEELTNWIVMKLANIGKLCGRYSYLREQSNITFINVESSNIMDICDNTIQDIISLSSVKWLNLANNNLTHISETFEHPSDSLTKLWLAGNSIYCDCSMVWMIEWLVSFTTPNGSNVVQDYPDIICKHGVNNSTPVYKLDKVKMGCYPRPIHKWIIIGTSVAAAIAVIFTSLLVCLNRHWNAVRWIIFSTFDKLVGDPDANEDISNKEFDAFLAYWY